MTLELWRDEFDLSRAWARCLRAMLFGSVGSTWMLVFSVLFVAPTAAAQKEMVFKGKPVHPACILALVDSGKDDPLPITVGVSLPGCMASPQSQIKVTRDGEEHWIEDVALLGQGGRFGYQALSRLENGIFAVVMRRIEADGEAQVSLAAIDLVERSMIRSRLVMTVPTLDLLGIVPLPDAQAKSFRRVGNLIRVKVGSGPNSLDRTVDLTELGKARKKR